jgi:endonuclease YncB( thermonuclease family)
MRALGWRPRIVALAGAVLVSFAGRAAGTPEFTGKVIKVIAGDLILIRLDRDQTEGKTLDLRVRLHGVLVPGETAGKARKYMSRLALNKSAHVTVFGGTRTRPLGWVSVKDANLSYELIKSGLAKWDRKRAPDYKILGKAEREARKDKAP